ncbi:MAG: hypothetical protein ABSD56_12040 [Bryobacteraceae bacterium]
MGTPLRPLWLLGVVAATLPAEIIDRIAVTVDSSVITASQVLEEVRVTAFLNGANPDFTPASRRQTADRLIEQLLVRREMDLTRYPQPEAGEVRDAFERVRAHFASEAAYRQALAEYRLEETEIAAALLRQLALLRFIELRFRPEIQVQESDVMQYYENAYLPAIRQKGVTPEPAFEDAREQCEQALTEQLVDQRVDKWLKEARGRARIVYSEEAFQ